MCFRNAGWAALLLAAGIAAGGCVGVVGAAQGKEADAGPAPQALGAAREEVALPEVPATQARSRRSPDGRKVIYTGRFVVVVEDVPAAVDRARRHAERRGGFVQHMTHDRIVLRVPADDFQAAVDDLETLGTVAEREITAEDVTDRYTDLRTRLKNQRALLERLRALLAEAQNVEDALAIEREIARVQAEVEKLQARADSLAGQVAYATLAVRFQRVRDAPEALRARLPFAWLGTLGLDELLSF